MLFINDNFVTFLIELSHVNMRNCTESLQPVSSKRDAKEIMCWGWQLRLWLPRHRLPLPRKQLSNRQAVHIGSKF